MTDRPSLGHVFRFSTEELALNRQGTVAPEQLRDERISGVLLLPALALALAVWAIVGKPFPDRFGRGMGQFSGSLFRVALAAAALLFAIQAGRALHAFFRPAVDIAEGLVTDVRNNPKGPASLVIDGVSLHSVAAYAEAREAVDLTTIYRAYYLRGSERLLSIEPASKVSTRAAPRQSTLRDASSVDSDPPMSGAVP